MVVVQTCRWFAGALLIMGVSCGPPHARELAGAPPDAETGDEDRRPTPQPRRRTRPRSQR